MAMGKFEFSSLFSARIRRRRRATVEQTNYGKHMKRHPAAFPLGVLLVLLAIVGVVFLAITAGKGIKQQTEPPKEYVAYAAFLKNIILNDTDPFDSVDKTEPEQLIDICLWNILSQDNADAKPYNFPQQDDGSLKVPQAAVEEEFFKLFGVKGPSVHETVNGADYEFIYDAESKAYLVPVTGILSIYLPKVRSATKISGDIILTVDYIGTNDWQIEDFNTDGTAAVPEPTKTMEITLHQTDTGYILRKIQSPQQQVTVVNKPRVTAAPSTAPPITQPPVTTTAPPTSAATTSAGATATAGGTATTTKTATTK
jgi:hypothetical protein